MKYIIKESQLVDIIKRALLEARGGNQVNGVEDVEDPRTIYGSDGSQPWHTQGETPTLPVVVISDFYDDSVCDEVIDLVSNPKLYAKKLKGKEIVSQRYDISTGERKEPSYYNDYDAVEIVWSTYGNTPDLDADGNEIIDPQTGEPSYSPKVIVVLEENNTTTTVGYASADMFVSQLNNMFAFEELDPETGEVVKSFHMPRLSAKTEKNGRTRYTYGFAGFTKKNPQAFSLKVYTDGDTLSHIPEDEVPDFMEAFREFYPAEDRKMNKQAVADNLDTVTRDQKIRQLVTIINNNGGEITKGIQLPNFEVLFEDNITSGISAIEQATYTKKQLEKIDGVVCEEPEEQVFKSESDSLAKTTRRLVGAEKETIKRGNGERVKDVPGTGTWVQDDVEPNISTMAVLRGTIN